MITRTDSFGLPVLPHAYCDHRCDRCPLVASCDVAQAEAGWASEAIAQGGRFDDRPSPDDLLDEALALVTAIAEREGVDTSAPSPPPSLDARRLSQASLAVVRAFGPDAAEPVRAVLGLLHTKIARVAGWLGPRSDDAWVRDAVPNLLLVEHTRARLAELVAATPTLATPPVRDALATLDRLLAPLLADLDGAREALATLIARHAAPSPFCVLEPLA